MKTNGERIFNIVNYSIMVLLCIIILYPVWYVLVLSFNEGIDAAKGGIYFFPRTLTFTNYKIVFENAGIVRSFMVTIMRTLVGVCTHVLFTATVAYGLSKTQLVGRKLFLTMGVITMFFNGGLIPTFLLIKKLGMLDSFLVYIIPTMFNFFELIIFTSFFKEIPASLEESARIDGANDMFIYIRIILPLSLPVLATIALFNGVWHWNDYFTGLIYINKEELQTIQTYLYRVIQQNSSSQMLANTGGAVILRSTTSKSIELATMVITTFPIVCVYPFLQKYFVKGLLIGSVKG